MQVTTEHSALCRRLNEVKVYSLKVTGLGLIECWVLVGKLTDSLNYSKLETKVFSSPLGIYLCEGSGFISWDCTKLTSGLLSLHVTVKNYHFRNWCVKSLSFASPKRGNTTLPGHSILQIINSSVCVCVSVYLYELLYWNCSIKCHMNCLVHFSVKSVSSELSGVQQLFFTWTSPWWQIPFGLVLWILVCSPQSCFCCYVSSLWAV